MSALFVIYLFIFSIGTCFRFDWHEDTFAWLMVQLFFMGVLSSAHLFGEAEGSLNSIKLDTLWSELFVCMCLCSILKSFFFLSLERVWQGWLHLWSLMKLKWCAKEAFMKCIRLIIDLIQLTLLHWKKIYQFVINFAAFVISKKLFWKCFIFSFNLQRFLLCENSVHFVCLFVSQKKNFIVKSREIKSKEKWKTYGLAL